MAKAKKTVIPKKATVKKVVKPKPIKLGSAGKQGG
jgi:hypothetical protein